MAPRTYTNMCSVSVQEQVAGGSGTYTTGVEGLDSEDGLSAYSYVNAHCYLVGGLEHVLFSIYWE